MIALLKQVYYCGFCRRHGLSRAAMEKHEAGCTMNPSRVCRWKIDGHSDGTAVIEIDPIAQELLGRSLPVPSASIRARPGAQERRYLTGADIAWLRVEVGGCPACMLAALRQSEIDEFHYNRDSSERIFDYQTEVERLRVEEREQAERDTWGD